MKLANNILLYLKLFHFLYYFNINVQGNIIKVKISKSISEIKGFSWLSYNIIGVKYHSIDFSPNIYIDIYY